MAITIGTVATNHGASDVVAASITITANDDYIIGGWCLEVDGNTTSNVTFNGVACTLVGTARDDVSFDNYSSIEYMLDTDMPGAGTYDFQSDLTASLSVDDHFVWVYALEGAKQQAPEASTAVEGTGSATSISGNITTLSDGAVIFDAVSLSGNSTNIASDNGTKNFDSEATLNSSDAAGSTLEKSPAGSQSMGYTWTTSQSRQALMMAAVAPLSFGGGGLGIPIAAYHHNHNMGSHL